MRLAEVLGRALPAGQRMRGRSNTAAAGRTRDAAPASPLTTDLTMAVAMAQEELWAAQNARIDGLYDMNNAIFLLDTDTSQFTTMLQRLSGEVRVTSKRRFEVGTLVVHDGFIHRVESVRRAHEDDWFAPDEWEHTLRRPWRERPETYDTKVRWLEDEAFPRLRSKTAIIRNITG